MMNTVPPSAAVKRADGEAGASPASAQSAVIYRQLLGATFPRIQ